MLIPSSRSSRTAFAALSGAVLAAAIAAAPASAGTYEQITRLSGAQGAAAFTRDSQPVGVSNDGRYGIFTSYAYGDAVSGTYVRDIQANTTSQLGGFPERILGFDATEATALVVHPLAGDDSRTVFALRPSGGGAEKVVYTTTATDDLGEFSGALSGDGKTVAIGGLAQLKVITVATGATKSYAVSGSGLNARSLSDDGSVIAGISGYSAGFKVVKGVVTAFDSPAVVSPDGSTIARYGRTSPNGSPDQLIVEKANGTGKKKVSLPDGGRTIAWIAPDGSSVALGNGAFGGKAQRFTYATGTFSVFGGPFADSIDADLTGFTTTPSSVISRNGRFAILSYGNVLAQQAAVVALDGSDLPGDQEPISASSYVQVSPVLGTCGQDYETFVNFVQPATWLPKPQRGEVSISVGGKVLYANTNSAPVVPYDDSTLRLPVKVTIPQAATSVSIAAKAVDAAGNTVTTTEAAKPYCFGSFPL